MPCFGSEDLKFDIYEGNLDFLNPILLKDIILIFDLSTFCIFSEDFHVCFKLFSY